MSLTLCNAYKFAKKRNSKIKIILKKKKTISEVFNVWPKYRRMTKDL